MNQTKSVNSRSSTRRGKLVTTLPNSSTTHATITILLANPFNWHEAILVITDVSFSFLGRAETFTSAADQAHSPKLNDLVRGYRSEVSSVSHKYPVINDNKEQTSVALSAVATGSTSSEKDVKPVAELKARMFTKAWRQTSCQVLDYERRGLSISELPNPPISKSMLGAPRTHQQSQGLMRKRCSDGYASKRSLWFRSASNASESASKPLHYGAIRAIESFPPRCRAVALGVGTSRPPLSIPAVQFHVSFTSSGLAIHRRLRMVLSETVPKLRSPEPGFTPSQQLPAKL